VLRVLVRLYQESGAAADHVSVCQCLMFLNDAPAVAALLEKLICGSEARARCAARAVCKQQP
jgi:26S proteasome regulatory subunit N2